MIHFFLVGARTLSWTRFLVAKAGVSLSLFGLISTIFSWNERLFQCCLPELWNTTLRQVWNALKLLISRVEVWFFQLFFTLVKDAPCLTWLVLNCFNWSHFFDFAYTLTFLPLFFTRWDDWPDFYWLLYLFNVAREVLLVDELICCCLAIIILICSFCAIVRT
jgi:hypothetical protein